MENNDETGPMIFWISALGLAGLAALTMVLALRRGAAAAAAPAVSDLDVYRDQLREVERDLARGILSQAEAERVRNEVSRRLLEADRALSTAAAPAAAPSGLTLAVALGLGLVVIGGSVLLYYRLGAPQSGDQPIRARIAMAEEVRLTRPSQAAREAEVGPQRQRDGVDPSYLEMIEQLRAVVAGRPDDARGLALLARNEAALGNYRAAHAAQARLIAVKGEAATGQDYSELAEFLILAGAGYVSPEAEAALSAALTREPGNPIARYFLGLFQAQIGRPDLAFPVWERLLAEGPADAPWVRLVRDQIEDLAWLAGRNDFVLPPEPAMRGPSAADVQAAGEMTAEDRAAMVRSMVEGLAARLAGEGGPAADWARLIRAYGVLGEPETARPVLEEARASFAADPAALAEIEAAARDAGLAP